MAIRETWMVGDMSAAAAVKPRTIMLLSGLTGIGKTFFGLNYMPDPIMHIGMDGRSKTEIKKAIARGRKIGPVEIKSAGKVMSVGTRKISEEAGKKAGIGLIEQVVNNIYLAAESSLKPGGIRSTILDTEKELAEIFALAYYGKISEDNSSWGKDTLFASRYVRQICEIVRDSNLHLLVIGRMKKHYTGSGTKRTWDGKRWVYSGLATWEEEATIGITLKYRPDIEKHEIEVTKAGENLPELGKVYTQDDWMEDHEEATGNPFSFLGMVLQPGSKLSDWENG